MPNPAAGTPGRLPKRDPHRVSRSFTEMLATSDRSDERTRSSHFDFSQPAVMRSRYDGDLRDFAARSASATHWHQVKTPPSPWLRPCVFKVFDSKRLLQISLTTLNHREVDCPRLAARTHGSQAALHPWVRAAIRGLIRSLQTFGPNAPPQRRRRRCRPGEPCWPPWCRLLAIRMLSQATFPPAQETCCVWIPWYFRLSVGNLASACN
ncbi:hypothetical protein Mal15_22810 [Stieleria maiorica]|uniref:Uncharacterized protein n=1 Tax=Stieleria maiorica TaxID=2795974 RepID=A0A5B9MAH3_9BACT|nr:hypothetical protein Mal15_22810 [Stieleria maiorica]